MRPSLKTVITIILKLKECQKVLLFEKFKNEIRFFVAEMYKVKRTESNTG